MRNLQRQKDADSMARSVSSVLSSSHQLRNVVEDAAALRRRRRVNWESVLACFSPSNKILPLTFRTRSEVSWTRIGAAVVSASFRRMTSGPISVSGSVKVKVEAELLVSEAGEAPARPPVGYAPLRVKPAEIVLPLTISNKCGQAFRWHATTAWPVHGEVLIEKKEQEDVKPSNPNLAMTSTSLKSKAVLDGTSAVSPQTIEYSICLNDRVVLLRQDVERGYLYHKTILPTATEDHLVATPIRTLQSRHANAAQVHETELWLHDYLNLRVPLAELYEDWSSRDAVFARFATTFRGVRMLRQDPWECLCAFICSSNNNIARIGQMVQKLATQFSDPMMTIAFPLEYSTPETPEPTTEPELDAQTITYYPFPPPSALAQPGVEAKLRELGFGYRAKFLAQTAQMLCSGDAMTSQNVEDGVLSTRSTPKGKGKKRMKIEVAVEPLPSSPAESAIIVDALVVEGSTPRRSTRAAQRLAVTTSTTPSSIGIPTPAPSPSALATAPVPEITVSDDEVHGYLASLRNLSYEQARELLLRFQGVGPKVADCILLMSLDQPSSIPVDRHVFSFGARWYGLRSERYEDVASALRDLWGDWAGWAHSILFTADLRAFAKYEDRGGAKKEEMEVGPVGQTTVTAADTHTNEVKVEGGKGKRRR